MTDEAIKKQIEIIERGGKEICKSPESARKFIEEWEKEYPLMKRERERLPGLKRKTMHDYQPFSTIGFHSCDKEVGLRVLNGEDDLLPSKNSGITERSEGYIPRPLDKFNPFFQQNKSTSSLKRA